MRLTYLVPTRGRPANARRLAESFAMTTGSDTRLIFLVDDDDPEISGYLDLANATDTDDLKFGMLVNPRLRLGGTLNAWAPAYAEEFDAIGFMGDDHVPRTIGWADELGSDVERTRGIAYGNDLIQGANLPTAVLMHSSLIRALGFMVPPGLVHMYLDNFWRDLGNELGRLTYRPDVIIEHVHPITGAVAWDNGYTDVNTFMGEDGERYHAWMNAGGMAEAVAKIRAAG